MGGGQLIHMKNKCIKLIINTSDMNSHYLHKNYQLNVLFNHLNPHKPGQGRYPDLVFLAPRKNFGLFI